MSCMGILEGATRYSIEVECLSRICCYIDLDQDAMILIGESSRDRAVPSPIYPCWVGHIVQEHCFNGERFAETTHNT